MSPAAIYSSPAVTTTTSIGTIQEQVPRSELSLEHRLDCAVQCAGQFRGLGLKSSSWYLVFSCRGRLFLLSRHRESKNKRHPTCLFILWNICGKQENDKHPCSKSNIFDLWNFRNIIYTFDCAELSIQQNPNLWLRTEDIWMAPQSHSSPHLNLGHVQRAVYSVHGIMGTGIPNKFTYLWPRPDG